MSGQRHQTLAIITPVTRSPFLRKEGTETVSFCLSGSKINGSDTLTDTQTHITHIHTQADTQTHRHTDIKQHTQTHPTVTWEHSESTHPHTPHTPHTCHTLTSHTSHRHTDTQTRRHTPHYTSHTPHTSHHTPHTPQTHTHITPQHTHITEPVNLRNTSIGMR